MAVVLKRLSGGNPQLQSKPLVPLIENRSLLTENRSIVHLKPTDQKQHAFWAFIERIWNIVLNWLYPFERTNYVGIVSALDRDAHVSPSALNPKHLLNYLHKFFEEDTASSPALSRCVGHLQEQINALEVRGLTSNIPHNKTDQLPQEGPLRDWADRILQLEEGQQHLIIGNPTPGQELFYLFSRKGGQTFLEIMGSSLAVSSISPGQQASAGQAQLFSRLHYGAVDKGLIEQLLVYSPLGNPDPAQLIKLLQGQAAQPVPLSPTTPSTTRADPFGVFWNVLGQVNHNTGSSEGEFKRTQLRLELFTLFNLLKEHRDNYGLNVVDIETVSRMLRICAQNLTKAHREGIVSANEMDALVEELRCVQHTIDDVRRTTPTTLPSLTMPSMHMYPSRSLTAVSSPASISPPSLKPVANPRSPHLVPPKGVRGPDIVRQPAQAHQALPILDQLKALTVESTPQQIVQTIYEMEFSPDRAKSAWLQISQVDAIEIMQHLNCLSKQLVDCAMQEKESAIDMHTALIKMSCMVVFLTRQNEKVPSVEFALLSDRVYDFSYKHGENFYSDRFGESLHPRNVRSIEEIRSFSSNLRSQKDHIFSGQDIEKNQKMKEAALKRLSEKIEGLVPLQFQVALLSHLTPHQPRWSSDPGSLHASIHGWIAPLPFPLLAAYHTLSTEPGRVYSSSLSHHRGTPEAIQHDPESVLREFEALIMKEGEGVRLWRDSFEASPEILPFYHFRFYHLPDIQDETLLTHSPYSASIRDKHIRTLLKKQEEYFLRASQTGIQFSKAELTAILSLFRTKDPQKQIVAFLKTHTSLLRHAAVRSVVQLIFFHPSLMDTIGRFGDREFTQFLPRFLAKTIATSQHKARQDPSEIPTLVFLIQMSERLKGIYQIVKEVILSDPSMALYSPPIHYDTPNFFPIENETLEAFLKTQRAQDPGSPANVEIMGLQLHISLRKPRLSQDELCQVILDMHQLKAQVHRASSFDYRELFWMKGRYQELMQEVACAPETFDSQYRDYVLDSLCHQRGLLLDHSPWTGRFPHFANQQYKIDLETGIIEDLASSAASTQLPTALMTDPLFRKSFPDLIKDNLDIKALASKTQDGTTVYFFDDLQKNPCRVEERGGEYVCYRSFPKAGHPELLQAAAFTESAAEQALLKTLFEAYKSPDKKKGSQFPDLWDLLKSLLSLEKEAPPLPALLQQRLFIDPQAPTRGYLVSSEGDIQFEVTIEHTSGGAKITSVTDLRGAAPSKPMQLVSARELDHTLLKQLERIEHSSHIIAWGSSGGSVETVELPRYGLQFALKNGTLVCTTPAYAGYELCLSASVAERKGFAFSILLQHSDRTRPKKLLLPPSEAIVSSEMPEPSYSGLAYIIYLIKTLIAAVFYQSFSTPFSSPYLHIKADGESLSFISVDVQPHTEELIFATLDKETHSRQELILHAFKLGDYELAAEIIRSLHIEEDGKAIQKWISFLKKCHENGFRAAVGLKICDKLLENLQGQKKYTQACNKVNDIKANLLKIYLKEERNLNPSLRRAQTQAAGQQKAPLTIQALEGAIKPETPIDRSSLPRALSLNADPLPLLFDESQLAPYFDLTNKRFRSSETLLTELVRPKVQELEKEKAHARQRIEQLLATSTDSAEQLAIYAKDKRIAQFSDLHLALLQKDFKRLQDTHVLPKDIDLQTLESAVIRFYDLEIRLHLITRCEAELSSILADKHAPDSVRATKAAALFDQLSYHRQYKPEEHPELLAFEAFHFVTFRNSSHPSQLELLQELLQSEASIVQAGTGTGKSSVLSVLRALMRANGNNLVSQRVLPHLYQETLAILQGRLGQTFHRKVYPLLFNQSMPLSDKEGNSLFEQIYLNLLKTIQNKGCVLTDYKSFVLMEQKFLTLSKTISAQLEEGVSTPAILMVHWFYLAKILTLLNNRDDALMDEFDQPLNAVQRIQTQLREGPLLARWMIDEALSLFDLLAQEKPLMLEQNLQAEVSREIREQSIRNVARQLGLQRAKGSATAEMITQYLMGESEEVLQHLANWSNREKDALAFLKEECFTYLRLTLSRSGTSDYARSKDGKKITTCSKGEKRDAKFGNPIEEINYSIQDYLQKKVAFPTLRQWVLDAKKDWATDPESAEKRFQDVLPGVSLTELAHLPPDAFEDRMAELLIRVNQLPAAVRFFLRRHLESLRTSGIVASMNPHNSVAMSRAVTGVSATTGSLGSLHEQFQRDPEAAKALQSNMLSRLRGRSAGDPIRYSPLDPLALLKKVNNPKLCALIDGSGAFRGIPPQQVAQALLEANRSLQRVDYYDEEGRLSSVGDVNSTALAARGFYFPEAQTRGSDQVLRPDGLAIMTATEKGDVEDFIQEEGRMRHPDQRVLVALSEYASASINSLDALIAHKEANKKTANAEDHYRAEIQRLTHMMREGARRELLNAVYVQNIQALIRELEQLQNPQPALITNPVIVGVVNQLATSAAPFCSEMVSRLGQALSLFTERLSNPFGNHAQPQPPVIPPQAPQEAPVAPRSHQNEREKAEAEIAARMQAAMRPFLNIFRHLSSLFIQTVATDELPPGEYFQKHQRLVRCDADPIVELARQRNALLERCRALGIVSPGLEVYNLVSLGSDLPKHVLPASIAEHQRQEVMEELELNNQLQTETDEQTQATEVNPNKVEAYLPRLNSNKTFIPASQLHPAFSQEIRLRDPYLPLDRTDPLHKRTPFDDRTPRIGSVQVVFPDPKTPNSNPNEFECIYVGDFLDEVDVYCYIIGMPTFHYDIRIDETTQDRYTTTYPHRSATDTQNSTRFHAIIAQIKFLDGMTDGYKPEEITQLSRWLQKSRRLQENGVEDLETFFTSTILKHRPETKFRHSQLWKLFQELKSGAPTPAPHHHPLAYAPAARAPRPAPIAISVGADPYFAAKDDKSP